MTRAASRCMGRSRGGLTTKIHALVDANGLPITLKLTEGQAHDGRSAADMLDTLGDGDVLLADPTPPPSTVIVKPRQPDGPNYPTAKKKPVGAVNGAIVAANSGDEPPAPEEWVPPPTVVDPPVKPTTKPKPVQAKRLDAVAIKHAPTIGAMYEGLTADILGRAVPPGLDLKIVNGFAIDGKGGTTGQLDCMLVRGDGSPVPYVADMYQWHVQDVLAVFEVKKKLFGSDLGEAYDQLKSVTAISSSWLQGASGPANFSLAASMRAYAECTGDIAPSPDDWATMDPARHLIMHTIMIDQIAPVRIMLGYFGYSTEGGLRRGFSDLLEKNLQTLGFGPPTLPNLMIANDVSLVKLSGHPYRHPLLKDGYWPILASSHVNPTQLILEAIWTRISYLHPVSELFGEDLEVERLSPFIEVLPKIATTPGGKTGWMYRAIPMTASQLADGADHAEWQPVELDDEQFVVIDRLCREDVFMTDLNLLTYLANAGRQPDSIFQSLVDTNLVARDGSRLVLTTTECATVILPDGRSIAAENNTGRLTRWLDRYMKRRADAATGATI